MRNRIILLLIGFMCYAGMGNAQEDKTEKAVPAIVSDSVEVAAPDSTVQGRCQYRMQLYAYSDSAVPGTHGHGSGRHLVGGLRNDDCQRNHPYHLVSDYQKENSLKKVQ